MGPVVPPATPVVSTTPTAVPIPGQSDMSALAEILRLVIPSRQTPGEAPQTPQKRHRRPPSASDIDHFLQYLQVHPEYGVHQTPDLHAVLTEADAGPDVLADIDLREHLRSPLKLKLGTAQRLKSGARAWLAQPEERQKIPRLDLTGASSSTGVTSSGPKARIVNYEWKFAQGGGCRWSGTWSMVRSHLIERGILYGSLMIHWGPGWRSLLGLWSRAIMTGFDGCTKG